MAAPVTFIEKDPLNESHSDAISVSHVESIIEKVDDCAASLQRMCEWTAILTRNNAEDIDMVDELGSILNEVREFLRERHRCQTVLHGALQVALLLESPLQHVVVQVDRSFDTQVVRAITATALVFRSAMLASPRDPAVLKEMHLLQLLLHEEVLEPPPHSTAPPLHLSVICARVADLAQLCDAFVDAFSEEIVEDWAKQGLTAASPPGDIVRAIEALLLELHAHAPAMFLDPRLTSMPADRFYPTVLSGLGLLFFHYHATLDDFLGSCSSKRFQEPSDNPFLKRAPDLTVPDILTALRTSLASYSGAVAANAELLPFFQHGAAMLIVGLESLWALEMSKFVIASPIERLRRETTPSQTPSTRSLPHDGGGSGAAGTGGAAAAASSAAATPAGASTAGALAGPAHRPPGRSAPCRAASAAFLVMADSIEVLFPRCSNVIDLAAIARRGLEQWLSWLEESLGLVAAAEVGSAAWGNVDALMLEAVVLNAAVRELARLGDRTDELAGLLRRGALAIAHGHECLVAARETRLRSLFAVEVAQLGQRLTANGVALLHALVVNELQAADATVLRMTAGVNEGSGFAVLYQVATADAVCSQLCCVVADRRLECEASLVPIHDAAVNWYLSKPNHGPPSSVMAAAKKYFVNLG